MWHIPGRRKKHYRRPIKIAVPLGSWTERRVYGKHPPQGLCWSIPSKQDREILRIVAYRSQGLFYDKRYHLIHITRGCRSHKSENKMTKGAPCNSVAPRVRPAELLPYGTIWPKRLPPPVLRSRAMKPAEDQKHVLVLHAQAFDTPWYCSVPGKCRAMKRERAVDSSPFRTALSKVQAAKTFEGADDFARDLARIDNVGIGHIERLVQ